MQGGCGRKKLNDHCSNCFPSLPCIYRIFLIPHYFPSPCTVARRSSAPSPILQLKKIKEMLNLRWGLLLTYCYKCENKTMHTLYSGRSKCVMSICLTETMVEEQLLWATVNTILFKHTLSHSILRSVPWLICTVPSPFILCFTPSKSLAHSLFPPTRVPFSYPHNPPRHLHFLLLTPAHKISSCLSHLHTQSLLLILSSSHTYTFSPSPSSSYTHTIPSCFSSFPKEGL